MAPLVVAGIVSAAISIGSSIWGAITGNKKRKKAEAKLKQKKKELTEWRDGELQQNFLDRADSQAAMRRVKEHNEQAMEGLNTNAIKTGATDQAKVAAASKLNKNYAGVVSQIAGVGAQHKDRVQQQYLQATANLDNLEIQNLMDNSGTQAMINGISNAGTQLASLYAGGAGGAGGA